MHAGLSSAAPRARRPALLLLVYGAVLIIVGITATSQAGVVSSHYTQVALETVVELDTAAIRGVINRDLTPADLEAPPSASSVEELQRGLATLLADRGIVHVEIRRPDGTALASSGDGAGSSLATDSPAFTAALAGTGGARLLTTSDGDPALQELLPIRLVGGDVVAVAAIWRDAAPITAALDAARREIVLLTLSAGFVVAVLLTLIFRATQRRLTRQTGELVEATRRDALSGLLNHGALVGALVERIETARLTSATLGVAIVDIDNFRALNDIQGHVAGDEALLEVAAAVERVRQPGSIVGRYGPDEFLMIVGAADAAGLEAAIERLRKDLAGVEIVGDAEALPLTVSAGVARYPLHGEAATSLLSAAATALGAAQSSGGNATRTAETDAEPSLAAATFDVFQGLVLAIDTKDRYTKRHSEDVARYAMFIARQLGLDETFLETLRLAGLLHDVGKIGIPDPILRKPGRLLAAEFDILKQHVALGDAIVRDLPDIDVVRSGIRHHHERWDGKGYLEGLKGEDIPLVARILAIGDTFSAMTTSRPYRRSLGVAEAIRRLEDAAGSQLDEHLVRTFITAMETQPDAPIPGAEPVSRLWTPIARPA